MYLFAQQLNEIAGQAGNDEGLTATDVIDRVGRNGKAVLSCLAFRRLGHYADDTLNDIIDISKVAAAVAVVIDLDGLPCKQLIRKAEVRHVGPAGRAVDRKEPQAG